jgi:hypothetical protein
MAINQISTANTFEQWLITTQNLVAVANNLTDGNGATFLANTIIDIDGDYNSARLNVRTSAAINILYANTANLANVSFSSSGITVPKDVAIGGNAVITGNSTISNLIVTQNLQTLNVTSSANIGGDLRVSGNVIVTGNLTLDSIGFDDLDVAGSVTVGTKITAPLAVIANANVESFVGTANTGIWQAIDNLNTSINNVGGSGNETALAYAIALG